MSQFGVQACGPQAKAVRTHWLAATQTSGLATTRTSTRETGLLQNILQVSGLAAIRTSNKINGLAATCTSMRDTEVGREAWYT